MRRRLPGGKETEQSLFLLEGWTLEVYILQQVASGRESVGQTQISLHLRKQGDAPNSQQDLLLEAAYVALSDKSSTVNWRNCCGENLKIP